MRRLVVLALIMAMVSLSGWADGAAAGPKVVAPRTVNDYAAEDSAGDYLPSVAAGAPAWVVVWQSQGVVGSVGPDPEILFARSMDGGWTWSEAAPVDAGAVFDDLEDVNPDVAGSGNTFVAVWSVRGLAGADSDLVFARSVDAGVTWSAPVLLAPDAGTDVPDDDAPRVVTDGLGSWAIVWHTRDDTVPGVYKTIRVSSSADDGATWSVPQTLTPANRLAQTPHIAMDDSAWVITWDLLDTDHDIQSALSDDKGLTWSPASFVNTGHATDTENDMLPTIASDDAGGWIAAWRSMEDVEGSGTDWDILYSRSSDGLNWSDVGVLNSNAFSDSAPDEQPVIWFRDGVWTAVWQSSDDLGSTIGNDWDLLLATSADGGTSWTAAAPLNANAVADAGHDSQLAAAIDSEGNAIVVWQSTEDLGGSGSDLDIAYISCSPFLSGPDGDCDGFTTVAETALETHADVACGYVSGGTVPSESWPPDLAPSNSINIADVIALKPVFGTAVPPTLPRMDLAPNGSINIADVVALKPFFGMTCVPP